MRMQRPIVKTVLSAFALGVAAWSVVSVPSVSAKLAAPEPDPIPRRWQLDLKLGALRMAKVAGKDGSVKSYLYATYQVTNKAGEDILFAPSFELADGEGHVLRSGRGVPLDVAEKLQKDLNNPYLEDQISILGMLLQGAENAKDGIVIWPFDNMTASDLTVYAAGFSGEVHLEPVKDPKTGETKSVAMYKTLMTRYKTGGDMSGRGTEPFEAYESNWIMR